jgi:hypothetical protein
MRSSINVWGVAVQERSAIAIVLSVRAKAGNGAPSDDFNES